MKERMKDIDQMKERVRAFRDARDWKQFHTPKDMAISLMLESAEVAELFQFKRDDELVDIRERLGEELSDVLYWVVLLAHDFGIDLPTAFENKMQCNEEKYPVEKAKGSAKKYITNTSTTK